MFQKYITLICFIFLLSGCALPRSNISDQDFISPREVSGVSLAHEAMDLFHRHRLIEAELKMRQARYMYPEAKNLKVSMAVILERSGQFAEAEDFYRSLLHEDPEYPDALSGLASTFFRRGEYQKAVEYYDRAFFLVLKSGDLARAAALKGNLATIEFRQGNEYIARCLAEEAYFLLPSRDNLIKLVRYHVAAGDLTLGYETLTQWMGAYGGTGDGDIVGQLAVLNYVLGNKEDAEAYQKIALDLNIQDPGLKAQLELFVEEDEEDKDADGIQEEQSASSYGSMLFWPVDLARMAREGNDISSQDQLKSSS